MYETMSSLETIVKHYEMYCELALSFFIYIVIFGLFSALLDRCRKVEGKTDQPPGLATLSHAAHGRLLIQLSLTGTHELALCYHK